MNEMGKDFEGVIETRAYWKVDEHDELVDIRTLSKPRLSSLIEHYQDRSNRARSASMKTLYAGIHEDLIKFRESRLVPHAEIDL